jgi:2-polyprenyl-3-methyl-5-hydroxy-6-metoxy-1,4-benzoquinol methylase
MNRFNLTPQSKIIDFGCGPGLYTSRFAEAGIDVTGVDFSRTSIQYAENFAKEHQLDVKYVHQNYLEFESDDKYDLITLIFCDFCALSPLQRAKLLEIFRRHLKPDGSIFMDVHSLNVYEKRDEIVTYEFNQMNRFWSQYDYYSFLNIFKYEDEKVTLDKYTIIEEHRTRVVYNWLQYYSLESLQNELNDNELQVVDFYSDVCGKAYSEKSDDIAVILKAR